MEVDNLRKLQAIRTLESAIRGGLVATHHITNLNISTDGPVIEAIINQLLDSKYSWIWKELDNDSSKQTSEMIEVDDD
jgi:hypothetical protein